MDQETQYPGQRMDHPQHPEVNGHRDEPTLTYSIQELEALCAAATPGPWAWSKMDDGVTALVRKTETGGLIILELTKDAARSCDADAAILCVARTAIPELIAAIRFYSPGFHAAPSAEVTARVEALHAEAAAKRAKLDSALKDAKLGDTEALSALGLEAYFEDDGSVKIRNKTREARP